MQACGSGTKRNSLTSFILSSSGTMKPGRRIRRPSNSFNKSVGLPDFRSYWARVGHSIVLTSPEPVCAEGVFASRDVHQECSIIPPIGAATSDAINRICLSFMTSNSYPYCQSIHKGIAVGTPCWQGRHRQSNREHEPQTHQFFP